MTKKNKKDDPEYLKWKARYGWFSPALYHDPTPPPIRLRKMKSFKKTKQETKQEGEEKK